VGDDEGLCAVGGHPGRARPRAGGEAGKQELPAIALGRRLAEVRRARGLIQQQVADQMGITKGRVSQIEQGKISGQDPISGRGQPISQQARPSLRTHHQGDRL
jgi:DNA-binding XRE family transcriptional regulator